MAVNVTRLDHQHPDQIGGEGENGDQGGWGFGYVGGAEKHIYRQYNIFRPEEELFVCVWGWVEGGGGDLGNGGGRGALEAFSGSGCWKCGFLNHNTFGDVNDDAGNDSRRDKLVKAVQ